MDWDEHGHCVICHKNMIYEQIIDGKPQKRYAPDYTEKEFTLDDGSRMRVAMCLSDAEKLTPKDNKKVMDCVIKGWDRETDKLAESPLFPHWNKERKDKHMEVYRKKKIVGAINDAKKG